MLGLGCLVKDTRIVNAIAEIMEARAADNITMGFRYPFTSAYHELRNYDIEIDMESVAAIYAEIFDTNEDHFTSVEQLESIVGRKFEDALDKISTIRPFTGIKKLGDMSPGKAAANHIALMFDRGMKLDEGTSSVMKVFQEKMEAAAEYYLDKTVFPSEGDKATRIQQIEQMLESGTLTDEETRKYQTILKRLKGKSSFVELLNEAFDLRNAGYERIDGGMNNINDVFDEFKAEIYKYTTGLWIKYNEEIDPARRNELYVAVTSFEKHTDIILNKMLELYMSENEISSIVKQTLIDQGFGRRVNDKKGKLTREIQKLDKLYAKADDDISRTEIQDRKTVVEAELASIEKAEEDLAIAEREYRELDTTDPNYEFLAEEIQDRIFKLKNYLDNINMALDWKKITFVTDVVTDDDGNIVSEGIEALKYHVTRALRNTGFRPENIEMIHRALETEYLRLKKDVAEKKLSELIRKNEAKPIQGSNTETRKLSKLYSYGWFDERPETYEKIVRDALGVNQVDAETFDALKKLSRDAFMIYEQRQNDEFTKTALNDLNQQIGDLLQKYARDQNMFYKVSFYIHDILAMSMRALLTSVSNYTQNTISGLSAVFTEKLVSRRDGIRNADTLQEGYVPTGNKDYKDMTSFMKEMASAIFDDISYNKGTSYGDLSSTFMYRGGLDRMVDKIENPKVRSAATFLSGRMFLDAMDSRYKFSLTHTYFVSNMAKILETQFGYGKQEALQQISERLYGYSFERAMENARTIVNRINAKKQPGEQLFRTDEKMIMRMANDLVKMNLLDIDSKIDGKRITEDMILMAYNSAYDSAGYRIGHVPNNWFSSMVQGLNSKIGDKLDVALKRGDYYTASQWKIIQGINMSFLNPFGNGGTNWMVIAAELTGLGVLRAMPYYMRKKFGKNNLEFEDYDITNYDDLRAFKNALQEERRKKIQMARGVVGAASTLLLSSLVYLSLPGDDDDEKMAAFNSFVVENKKMFKYVSWLPLSWLYMYNFVKNDNIDYVMHILSLRYQDFEVGTMTADMLKLMAKGEDSEAIGKFGEIVGSFFRAPLPSYRVMKQFFDLTYTLGRIDSPVPFNKNDYSKSIGFWSGFTKFGVLSDLGLRVSQVYGLPSLPGAGPATMEALKELGVNNIEDLKQYLVTTYPDKSFSDAMSQLKKTTADGKKTAMFSRQNIAEIEEIVSNNNRKPKITIENVITNKEVLKAVRKKDIYTIPDLQNAINNTDFFNDPDIGFTPEQAQDIIKKLENYYEKIDK